ncbi:hypothetical protein HC024_20805 [Methylococcaceae bacterium WWC4]|nr:hypothetical protein [Methylococcaceae bacterium WWC4]
MDVVKKLHSQIEYEAYKRCGIKHQTANDCIECCSKPYFEQIAIDYTCPQKRKIYVARYAPAYISEIYSALVRTPKKFICAMLEKTEINVASIGGGPGTDIAAFKKWISTKIEDNDSLEKVRFLRVDINEDWDDISPKLINLYETSHIEFEYKKIVKDIYKQPINANSFNSFDVIILSYVISEMNQDEIYLVAKHISEVISEKTLVVVNDRPQNLVKQKIDTLIEMIGGEAKIIDPSERDHCGEFYPDEIYNMVGPTIFRKSIRYNVLVER